MLQGLSIEIFLGLLCSSSLPSTVYHLDFPSDCPTPIYPLAIMSKVKEIDEKQQPGYVLGTEVDETSSFDTITALVAEGIATFLPDRLISGSHLF